MEKMKVKNFDYFMEANSSELNSESFPMEFFAIVALMAEDCEYNITQLYSSFDRLFIEGETKGEFSEDCKLILRYNCGNLTIAKLKFINTRQGKMTELYRLLKQIKKKYGYEHIVLENSRCKEGYF